jgi:molybdopterin-guanine dinucleotide biosynthesis protein A
MSENNILPIILAGGKSRRFGADKAFAKLGDKSLIDYTINKLELKFTEILVITNNPKKSSKNNIFFTKDTITGQLGPLVGILSAMEWIKNNDKNYEWIISFPCDTPFFEEKIIDKVINIQKSSNKKLFFLKSGNKRHNIFGLWSIDLMEQLRNDINQGARKVEDWANKIGTEIIEINSESDNNFLNINTILDLEEANKKLK